MPPVQPSASLSPGVPEWPSLPLTKPIWKGFDADALLLAQPLDERAAQRAPAHLAGGRRWTEPETCWNA